MKNVTKWFIAGAALAGTYGILRTAAKLSDEGTAADKDNPYLLEQSNIVHSPSFYEKTVKPALDSLLSFCGLIALSPVFAITSLAVYIDDPGPVFFSQKRVGKAKHFFLCHKFRTMKMDAPHNVPTHLLENPEQYITRTGRFLRKYSLDELPQIWDVYRHKMSLVGPRPALWNQADLIAERDKYGANDVTPGITGWAQINGRDELELAAKARYDGDYVKKQSLLFDFKCLFGTVGKVLRHESVVEGGIKREARPTLRPGVPETDPKPVFAFEKPTLVMSDQCKRVLITGAGSYIGTSFYKYAERNYPGQFEIDTLDMRDCSWKEKNFTGYDCVFHVAGIAHVDMRGAKQETVERYYQVNTDLAIETAKKAKENGVSQFVFMSSMIIYGDAEYIDVHTRPKPSNFYGDSKWQADRGIRALADETFCVAILRPPMIYGRGCQGNYPKLARLAKALPAFPKIGNKRSMLYIDNFCEFLCGLIRSGAEGIYFPQNKELADTGEVVMTIAEAHGRNIALWAPLTPLTKVARHMPGRIGALSEKAFSSRYYDAALSVYDGIDYQKISLRESIFAIECTNIDKDAICATGKSLAKRDRSGKPLFSVITVCYNSEKTIRATIESVLAQDYPNMEYLLIDGKSTDDTIAIAREYEAVFLQKGISYVIVSEPDDGIYDAMNKGLRLSHGEVIGVINSDDWYEPDAVQTVAEAYQRTGFDYYYADLRVIHEDGGTTIKHSKKDRLITSRHWNHPSCFVARCTYERLGLFRCDGIHDDFDFFLRVRKAGLNIVIENKILANYRVGGLSNRKDLQLSVKRCRDRYKCYRENGYSRLYILECIGIEAAKRLIK